MRAHQRAVLAYMALLASLPAYSAGAPSVAEIQAWAPPEQAAMGISIDKLVPVSLRGGEQAFLASVTYEESMRNGWAGYLLVRPSLKEARDLDGFGGQYNGIVPINSYEPSQRAVIIGTSSSGQGFSESTYTLASFDGWNVNSLYSVSESDNSGNCGEIVERYCKGNNVFINVLSVPAPAGQLPIAITDITYSSPDLDKFEATITHNTEIVFVEDTRP
tara:strand:+ start:2908 stop:3561 length:654 start_codon:yes stop_codon:yes gene_type:complete